MRTLKKMMKMRATNQYSTITTEELNKRYKLLHSMSEQQRLVLVKKCEELDKLYKELIVLDKELKERTAK